MGISGSTSVGVSEITISIVGNYQTTGNPPATTCQASISFLYSVEQTVNYQTVQLTDGTASFTIDWGDGTSTGVVKVKDWEAAYPIVESHLYVAPATGSTTYSGTLTVPGEYSFSVDNFGEPGPDGSLAPGGMDMFHNDPPVVQNFTVVIPSQEAADVGVANAFSGW
jgi:hypothetical protein